MTTEVINSATATPNTDPGLSERQREILALGAGFQTEVVGAIDQLTEQGLIREAPPTGQDEHVPGEQRFASPSQDRWTETAAGFLHIAEVVRPTDARGRTVVAAHVAQAKLVGAKRMRGLTAQVRIETAPDGSVHFEGIGIGNGGGTYKFNVNTPNPDARGADLELAKGALGMARTAFDRLTKSQAVAAPAPAPLPASLVPRP